MDRYVHSAADLGEVAVGNHERSLVADANFETGRAPVDKLNGALRLERRNGAVGFLGHNVATVEQARGHVLAVTRVAPDHLVVGLKARHGHLHDRVSLVRRLGSRDDGRVGNEREVDARVGDEIGLELVEIDVERTIESKRCRNRRDDWTWGQDINLLAFKFQGQRATIPRLHRHKQ